MQHIIINDQSLSSSISGSEKSVVLNQVEMGNHFNAFVLSQTVGPKPDGSFKKKELHQKVLQLCVRKPHTSLRIAILIMLPITQKLPILLWVTFRVVKLCLLRVSRL